MNSSPGPNNVRNSADANHRRRKQGVCRGSYTPNIFVGDIHYVYPLRKPSHANCMQLVLRCWERQSDGTEYKKTLRRPGLRPGGAYSAPANPHLVGRGWLPPSQEPHPPLSAFGASPLLPHKISSDAVEENPKIGQPRNSPYPMVEPPMVITLAQKNSRAYGRSGSAGVPPLKPI